MRLIDADKLKKDVLDLPDCYNGFSDTYDKACIIGVIDEQPTAQADVPDTNVGDTISRRAAIDYFVINVGFHDEDGYPIEDSDELRKIWTEYFDGIPSAQPEWEELLVICDNCGHAIHVKRQ